WASLLGSNDVGSSCGALEFEIASGVVVDIGLAPKRQQDDGKQLAAVHQKMLRYRPQRDSREIRQRGYDEDRANQQPDEERSVSGECPAGGCHLLLGRHASRDGENRNQEEETADQHRQAYRQVPPRRVRVQTGESTAVVPGATGVGVEDFTQPVRARVSQVGDRRPRIPVSFGGEVDLRTDGGKQQNTGGSSN